MAEKSYVKDFGFCIHWCLCIYDKLFHILSLNMYLFRSYKSYKMVDNKSKTSLIGHIQENILLMKINNIIPVLHTRVKLLSSFVKYFFCIYVIREVFLLYKY